MSALARSDFRNASLEFFVTRGDSGSEFIQVKARLAELREQLGSLFLNVLIHVLCQHVESRIETLITSFQGRELFDQRLDKKVLDVSLVDVVLIVFA